MAILWTQVAMAGSVHVGYGGKGDPPCAEHNVACDPGACDAALRAPWASVTLAPLDICDDVRVTGTYRSAAGSRTQGHGTMVMPG